MKWLKRIGYTVSILALIVFISVGKIDDSPILNSKVHERTFKSIEETIFTHLKVDENLKVGWSKVNITPDHGTRMAGFKIKHFDSVHDSMFVRSMVFDVGGKKVAWVTYDLIFVHPYLKDAILEKVVKDSIADFVYLSATHTHHSIGEWGKDPLTRILYGYDDDVFNDLVDQAVESIIKANENKALAKAGYFRYNESRIIRNRVDREHGIVDPFIRGFKVEQETGEKACLYTFAAHPTSVSVNATFLTGDYPAEVNDRLEKGKVDFAMFTAGATSSMRAKYNQIYDFEAIDWFSDRFLQNFNQAFDTLQLKPFKEISYAKVPIFLRKPNLRFADKWRFSPWLVNLLVDQKDPFIAVLKFDEVVCMGLPVEFSGEIMLQLDEKYKKQGLSLLVTGFNGNYLGYVNRDCYYHTKTDEEVALLNWYGPEAGNYFRAIIEEIIDKKVK